jgi:integrase
MRPRRRNDSLAAAKDRVPGFGRLLPPTLLDVGDVDLEQGVLTIRQTKFGKSRLVPVDTSTVAALDGYQTRRDRFLRGRPQRRFFVSGKGTPLAYFSDRGRLFQADRGRQNGVVEAALGKRAGTGLTVAESSTISLKRAAVGRLSGVGLDRT